MKRRFLLVVVCLLSLLVVGCSKKSEEASKEASGGTPSADRASKFEKGIRQQSDGKAPIEVKGATKPVHPKKPVDVGKSFTGLPSYPNAKIAEGPDETGKAKSATVETSRANYTTSDQPGAVAEYYMKLLINPRVDQKGELAYVSGQTASGAQVVVTAVVDYQNKSLTHIEVVVSRPLAGAKKGPKK